MHISRSHITHTASDIPHILRISPPSWKSARPIMLSRMSGNILPNSPYLRRVIRDIWLRDILDRFPLEENLQVLVWIWIIRNPDNLPYWRVVVVLRPDRVVVQLQQIRCKSWYTTSYSRHFRYRHRRTCNMSKMKLPSFAYMIWDRRNLCCGPFVVNPDTQKHYIPVRPSRRVYAPRYVLNEQSHILLFPTPSIPNLLMIITRVVRELSLDRKDQRTERESLKSKEETMQWGLLGLGKEMEITGSPWSQLCLVGVERATLRTLVNFSLPSRIIRKITHSSLSVIFTIHNLKADLWSDINLLGLVKELE